MRLVDRVRRRVVAAALAAAALTAALVVPAAAGAVGSGAVGSGAATVAPPDAPAGSVAEVAPDAQAAPAEPVVDSVTVDGINPVELRPDGAVTITGSVTTAQPSTGVTVVISRTVTRTGTRSAIGDWLAPPPQEPALRLDVLTTIALDPVVAGEPRPFTAVLDATDVGLRTTIAAAGPYGLLLDLVAAPFSAPDAPPGEPVSLAQAKGFLVWSPDIGIEPLQLGLVAVMPSFDPDPLTGLIDPALLEEQSTADGSLTRATAAAAALPATWSVDPLLLASATADDAGPAARDWVRGLTAARGSHEILVDPWGRPDPNLLAASGQDARLRDLLTAVRSAPGGTRLDLVDLLGGPVRTDVDVAPPGLRAEGLASIAGAGQVVLMPESVVPLTDTGITFTPDLRDNLLTTGGPVRALLTDGDLERSASAALADDPLALTTLVAQISATTLQRPNDQRVVGVLLDPAVAVPAAAAALAAAISTSSYLVPVGVETWLATPPAALNRSLPPPRDPAAAPTPAEVSAAVDRLLAQRQLVGELNASVVGERRSDEEFYLTAGSAVATSVEAISQVGGQFQAQGVAWQQGVRLVAGSSLLFAASTAEIRRTIVNETTDDVRLQVEAVSRSPRLRIAEDVGEVTIPAGGRVIVAIPVEAVSNGRAQVIIQLVTPGGTAWGPPTQLEVRVAAGAETGALVVAAVLITIVFVLGTVRTIRRSRRRGEPARI